MLVCKQCNFEQQSGKFCGQCGSPLVEQTEQAAEQTVNEKQVPEEVQNVESASSEEAAAAADSVQTVQRKNVLKAYVSFIGNVIKNPTRAFQLNDHHFGYALATIAIYALAYALANYFLANKMEKDMYGSLSTSLPFIDITVPLFFYILLFIAGALVSIFAAVKFMGNPASVKQIIVQFGGLLIPFMAINVVMILFGAAGMMKFTVGMTGLSLIFSLYFLPAVHVFQKGMESNSEQRVYLSLAAAAVSMLISYIIIRLAFLEHLENIDQIYYWL